MAKKNIIDTSDFVSDDEIIIGLVTNIAPYMACYQLSSILSCNFSICTTLWQTEKESSPEKSIVFEYFRWNSETKGKKILVIPNIQSSDTFEQLPKTSLYANEISVSTKYTIMLNAWKHVKYIMRFEGIENKEILEMAVKIRESKKIQLVITDYASKIDNTSVLYFFN